MNKSLQINIISNMLKKQGIEPDLIDLHALVDDTLTLSENANIIKKEYGLIHEEKQSTHSINKIDRFLKAIEIFEKKSWKQQLNDTKQQAKRTFEKEELTESNFNKWKEQTNRYDIQGVDSKYH